MRGDGVQSRMGFGKPKSQLGNGGAVWNRPHGLYTTGEIAGAGEELYVDGDVAGVSP